MTAFCQALRRAFFGRQWLLLEAAFWLLAARLALACLPFPRLMRWCTRCAAAPELTGAQRRSTCREVRAAIRQVALYLPGQTVCFPRAIAAQRMLRQRRVGTVLYYGAAIAPGCGLKAHVWLQDGEVGVIGHRAASQYHVLARYSSHTLRLPCASPASSNVPST